MPTSKKRLNVTLPKHLALFLEKIALRDDIPQATKAVELLEKALEIEEDEYLSWLGDSRASGNPRDYISHRKFWGRK